MKKSLIVTIVACGLSLALCQGVRAQDTPAPSPGAAGGHGHHGPGEMLDHLTKALNLTPDQVPQVKRALETQHTAMLAARNDTTLSQQEKMAKMKDARETANAQINAILTPDQQAKFVTLQQKMHNHKHPGEGGAGAPAATPAAPTTTGS
jgi:Spy/CpxP family protein refolding chaperone